MFSGIIENLGEVIALVNEQSNLLLTIKSSFTNELKIDQSIAHNGVCLTVVDIYKETYKVTAIAETLNKTNLITLKILIFLFIKLKVLSFTRVILMKQFIILFLSLIYLMLINLLF